MEAAKAAVSKLTGHRGHTTDVDEVVAPAVTSEVIKPHRHEEVTQAVDREVHQHHYHTTVQPLQHQEILPEKHTHNLVPTEHREFRHDHEDHTKERVAAELAQFKNSQTIHETRHTQAAAATVAGEHVHHHVHETVVPHIQKETIQPEVVHTTIPVHETHHKAAEYHGLSALPVKTLDEFTKAGGVLTGGKHHTHEEYEGDPRPYNEKLSTTFDKLGLGHHHNSTHHATDSGVGGVGGVGSNELGNTRSGGLTGTGHHDHNRTGGLTGTGRNEYDNTRSSGLTGTGRDEFDNTRSSGLTGSGRNEYDDSRSGLGNTTSNTSTGSKPSLMQKLNPKVDSNGDGKAGFMK